MQNQTETPYLPIANDNVDNVDNAVIPRSVNDQEYGLSDEPIHGVVKYHISPDQLLKQSYELGQQVVKSGFRPTFIVGIWRGGAPVGIAVQEFLKFFKIKADHISIRTSSYIAVCHQSSKIRVHGLEYIVEHANVEDSLLLVDDIFDSGRSIDAVMKTLQNKMRMNLPHDIRIATVFYKPENNKTDIIPNYFVESTDRWVVFPHELEDMTIHEIYQAKGTDIGDIVRDTQMYIDSVGLQCNKID